MLHKDKHDSLESHPISSKLGTKNVEEGRAILRCEWLQGGGIIAVLWVWRRGFMAVAFFDVNQGGGVFVFVVLKASVSLVEQKARGNVHSNVSSITHAFLVFS